LPLSVVVRPGDEHDSRRFVEVLDAIRVKRVVGRPKTRPEEVYADSAYDTKEVRSYLGGGGIKANIPVNPRNRLRPRRGRPYVLDEGAYRRMRSLCREVLRMAEGRLQEAGPKMGEAGVNIPRTHTAGVHNNILEGFEMSSNIE